MAPTQGLFKPPALPTVAIPTIPTPPASNNRIYIGSIHWDLSEEDVKSVFQTFGKIKNMSLMMNTETGKHKGYGFIEYDDPKAAEDAINLANGLELCGRPIKVGRAALGVTPPTTQLTAMPTINPNLTVPVVLPTATSLGLSATAINTAIAQKPEDSLSQEENITISGTQRYMIMQKLARGEIKTPSRVVVLLNMVTADEIDGELESEVTEECGKFGPVEKVVIYQEPQNEKDVVVKIFVMFRSSTDAQTAVSKLNNRWFGGRVIKAQLYDDSLFARQVYSG